MGRGCRAPLQRAVSRDITRGGSHHTNSLVLSNTDTPRSAASNLPSAPNVALPALLSSTLSAAPSLPRPCSACATVDLVCLV